MDGREKKKFGLIAKAIDEKKKLREAGYIAMDLEEFRSLTESKYSIF